MTTPAGHGVADPALDAPRPPRRGQSENLVYYGFDVERNISVWTHIGRLAPDPTICEAVLVVALPDGNLLHHRSIGRSVDQPGTAEVQLQCAEPGQRWRIHLDGVAHRVSKTDARRRPVGMMHLPGSVGVIDPYEHLVVDIEFAGSYPLCDTAVSGQGWGDVHFHQLGRMTGQIGCAGDVLEVNLAGVRDHTRGPRDYGSLEGQWWATCMFPSGRAFDLIQAWTSGGGVWSKGFVWNTSGAEVANDMQRVPAHTAEGAPVHFDIVVNDLPAMGTIAGEALDVFNYTLIRPTGMYPGYCAVDDNTHIMIDSPARFIWDGEVGHGWIERCRMVKDLAEVGD